MSNFIEPILATRKRPRSGLTTVASRLPAGADWRNGIEYRPEGCQAPNVFPICGVDVDPKELNTPQQIVRFDPFLIYDTDGCNDAFASNQELHDRAVRELEMGTSALIARELVESTVGNPDLASSAIDVSGGSAVGWTAALAALLYNMQNAGYVGDVWIHAPTWLMPAFLGSNAGQIELSTGLLYAGLSPAIFDAGYSGLVAPNGSLVVADPGVTGWVYATGPVEWDTGALLDDLAESSDNLSNDRLAIAEKPAIVRFDPCQVFAVLVEATCDCK